MVASPFHLVLAWTVHRIPRVRLCLPALIVGNLIPDLDFIAGLVVIGQPGRLVLHSILGAATVGTLLSIPTIIYIYPDLTRWVFKAKVDLSKYSLSVLSFSALLGDLSHVFIDALHHPYNPLLYPITNESIDTLVVFKDVRVADLWVQTTLGILFFAALAWAFMRHRDSFWDYLLSE